MNIEVIKGHRRIMRIGTAINFFAFLIENSRQRLTSIVIELGGHGENKGGGIDGYV